MMKYSADNLKINQFVAKIGASNEPSRKLFQKLGFVQTTEPNYFNEIEMRLKLEDKNNFVLNSDFQYTIVDIYLIGLILCDRKLLYF